MKEDSVTTPELRKELPKFEQVMEDVPLELTVATSEKVEAVEAPVSFVSREEEILEELMSKPEVKEMLEKGVLTKADLVEEAKQAAANERFFS